MSKTNGHNGHRTKAAAQEAIDLARILEIRTAERDAAERSLLALELIISKTGGYMTAPQQQAWREARDHLLERGLLKEREHLPWADKP